MKLLVPVSYFFNSPRSEIWQLDTATRQKTLLTSLPSSNRDVPGKGVTGLCWLDDHNLVACDFNRVVTLDSKTWRINQVLENDEFNDLHHLSVSDGHIYLANTGRDCIDVLSSDLKLVKRIDGLSVKEWQDRKAGRYTVAGSYYDDPSSGLPFHRRRVPDKWHFNHVFKAPSSLGDQIVATSFGTKSLVNAQTLEQLSSTLSTQPHDGFVDGDHLWVTTVSGQIFRAPVKKPFVFEQIFDLFHYAPYQGWCRGLFIHDEFLFIGITSIYEKSNRTRWLTQPIEDTRSGIYQLHATSGEIVHFHDFTSSDGSRIFSMLAAKQVVFDA